jgi:2'-5' RNA ligase
VPYAINIACRNETAAPVHRLWQEAAAFEAAPSMAALDYAPHITLAIYDEIEVDRLRAVAANVFEGRAAVTLTFNAIRAFDGPILYAAPLPSAPLQALHDAVHAEIEPALCHEHYRPGAWSPHCTLAMHVLPERVDAALAWTRRRIPPFKVTFDVGDCARFYPVEVLGEVRLS